MMDIQKQATLLAAGPRGQGDPAAYVDLRNRLHEIRQAYKQTVVAQGQFGVDSVKIKSQTEELTKALVKNRVSMKQLWTDRKAFNEVLKEQIALQNMQAVGWTRNGRGQISADLIIPNDLPKKLDSTTQKMRFWAAAMSHASTNMINWGKNTQWAGRQLTVGLSVPLTMLAAVATKTANDVDQQLTRIAKVYDTTFNGTLSIADQQIAREKELSKVRADAFGLAEATARKYGVMAKDTLDVEAELAATGLKGADLRNSTAEVVRIATLGELDYQKTVGLSISLQNAYGLSTEKVAEKFNFLNSIENATSLSLQDMVEAIPRAGAALGGLGVTVEQTGILLVAMKEHGVDAAEGANALKSATTRLLKPTADAQMRFAELGINIKAVADNAKGNLFTILNELAVRLKDVDPYKQQQAIAALFGTYQFNRLNAALSGITEAMVGTGDAASQTARAIEVAGQSTSDWANTAKSELDQLTNSASGKLKIALASVNAELAKVGQPLLEVTASVLTYLTRIVAAFDSLPDGAKKLVTFLAIVGALAGPMIMLAGLFANFVGNTIKLGATIVGLGKAFKFTTAEEKAAQILRSQSIRGFNAQATSAMLLSNAIQDVNSKLAQMNMNMRNQQLANFAAAMPPAVTKQTGASGTYYLYDKSAAGQPGVPKNRRATEEAFNKYNQEKAVYDKFEKSTAAAATSTAQIATNSQRASGHWDKIGMAAGGIGIAAIAMGNMVGSSSQVLSTMTNIAMVAALIGPGMFSGVGSKLSTAFSAGSSNIRAANGLKASMGATLTTVKNLVGAFGRFAGPAGLLVSAGLMVLKIRNDIKQTAEAQKSVNNSASEWSKILGFTYQEFNKDNVVAKAVDDVQKFSLANEELVKRLRATKDEQELLNMAIAEGIKVRISGGNADQALKAVQIALRASGKSDYEADQLMVKVGATIDFKNTQKFAMDAVNNFKLQFDKVAKNEFDQSWSESFVRAVFGGDELNTGAKTAAQGLAEQFRKTLDMQSSPTDRRSFFDNYVKQLESQGTGSSAFKRIAEKNAEVFKQANITSVQGLVDYMKQVQTSLYDTTVQDLTPVDLTGDELDQINRYVAAQKEIAKQVALTAGYTEDEAKKITSLAQVMERLNIPTRTATEAQAAYAESMRESSRAGIVLSESEKLAALNGFRASAGLDKATSSSQGFGAASTQAAGSAKVLSDAIEQAGISAEAMDDAFKSASGAAMDSLYSVVNSDFDSMMDARVDRITARGEQAISDIEAREEASTSRFEKKKDALDRKYELKQRKFDDDWTKIMQSHEAKWEKRIDQETLVYNKRISAIQKQIDAEKAAESTRQSIFEAEKTRLERLANLQNKNIDFTVALKSGNMDEAAKISNDIMAQNMQYTIDDAQKSSQSASEKKVAQLEARLEIVNKEKDARLDAIKKAEEAEQRLLERKKELARRALEDQKAAAQKSLEEQQRASQKSFEAEKKAQQRRNELNEKRVQREVSAERRKFELELKALQAFIPRDDKERKAHIKAVENLYNKYGGRFSANGKKWADIVGQSLRANMRAAGESLKSDVNWKSIGATAAADAISGAFGMTVGEFSKWVTQGTLPKDGLGGAAKASKKVNGKIQNLPTYHSGGIVGTTGARTGIPMSAPTRPSEVHARLLKGEGVLNRNAVAGLGHDFIDDLNSGKIPAMGGPDLGMSGLIGAGIAGMMRSVIQTAVQSAGNRRMQMDTGSFMSGKISGVKMSGEQLSNAAAIISAGKSFGASPRDLVIALMTALQESTLRNLSYGDRDSIGLFQQRNAWGSRAARMDPYQATKMFFYGGAAGQRGLFDFKNREKMSLTQAAQAVQVSAFPNAYAKWETLARQLLGGYSGTAVGGSGFMRPLSGRVTSEYGMRTHPITGKRRLHNGIDIAAPIGSIIHAAGSGGVQLAKTAGGYGKWTVLNHPGGIQTAYAHQSRFMVSPGQTVSAGQPIGAVGMTGSTTGPHLHFMVGKNGDWVNPRSLIPGLMDGGFTLNTGLAQLHPNEAVLTRPLTQELKDGIRNIDSSSQNVYNINVDARGSTMTEEEFTRATKKALLEIEVSRGVKRKVGAR